MKKIYQRIFFFILIGSCSLCKAQYSGGNSGGFGSSIYIPSPCMYVTNSNIYYGSDADGAASNSFIASVCPPLVSTNIYLGGNSNGDAINRLIATVCPPINNTNIFVGGDADGYASNSFIASVCPPLLSTNIYYGGNADGHAGNSFIASICPPLPNTSIYYGGNADGHAGNSFIVSICPPISNTNIYYGGISDGWSGRRIIQSLCPLPIELLFFNVNCKETRRLLTWSTASETNNNFFTIERSMDAIKWSVLITIDGAGNSANKRDYAYTDVSDYPSTVYYRLKQTDFDGKSEYFQIIYSDCEEAHNNILNVSPNPSQGKIILLYHGEMKDIHALEIYNAKGDKIYVSETFQSSIDLSANASGVYFIRLLLNSGEVKRKIVIEK